MLTKSFGFAASPLLKYVDLLLPDHLARHGRWIGVQACSIAKDLGAFLFEIRSQIDKAVKEIVPGGMQSSIFVSLCP